MENGVPRTHQVTLYKKIVLDDKKPLLVYRGTQGRELDPVSLKLFASLKQVGGRELLEMDESRYRIEGTYTNHYKNQSHRMVGIWGEKGLMMRALSTKGSSPAFHLDIEKFDPDQNTLRLTWFDVDWDTAEILFKEMEDEEAQAQDAYGEHDYRLFVYREKGDPALKTGFEVLDFQNGQLLYRLYDLGCEPRWFRKSNVVEVGDYNFDGVVSDVLIPCRQHTKGMSAVLVTYAEETESWTQYVSHRSVERDAFFDWRHRQILETTYAHQTKTVFYSRWNGGILENFKEEHYFLKDGKWERVVDDLAQEDWVFDRNRVGPLHKGFSLGQGLALFPHHRPVKVYFYDQLLWSFEVQDPQNTPLLWLTNAREDQNPEEPLRKIEILSPRYKSYNGISLNSRYGEIKRKFQVLNHELLEDYVVFRSPYFPNAQFWLDKKNQYAAKLLTLSLNTETFIACNCTTN